ncbi:putative alcohol dehydrogenase [Citrobacter koseri]|uniref:Putative alcohol dehydrogenase n=1 Tax=Citrobacter koseri TaxID=545 RepID=A0A3S4M615_CITKO|nr:putative alcohol dehydrogenase [Citrobacter koseri]
MAASTFFIPSVNVIGAGALKEAMNTMAEYGFRRTLIVTDSMLTTIRHGWRYSESVAGTRYFQRYL